MDGMEKFKGKKVKIVYKDIDNYGKETRSVKVGILENIDNDFLFIRSDKTLIGLAKSIVQRVEVE